MSELITLENVWAGYGEAIVLEGISLQLKAGDSLSLLGRNGMGKSTLLSTLMGAARFHKGSMRWQGRDLAAVKPHARAHLGLGWVPQERDIFPSLSVEENLSVVQTKGHWDLQKIYAMFPRLQERRANMGNQLSGGEQQMLAIGRALMLNPQLLLLDEPLEGLAPLIVQELLSIIQRLTEESGIAVILVEQHARQILPLTQQALVLERGKGVYLGPAQSLLMNSALLDSWLGVAAH